MTEEQKLQQLRNSIETLSCQVNAMSTATASWTSDCNQVDWLPDRYSYGSYDPHPHDRLKVSAVRGQGNSDPWSGCSSNSQDPHGSIPILDPFEVSNFLQCSVGEAIKSMQLAIEAIAEVQIELCESRVEELTALREEVRALRMDRGTQLSLMPEEK